MYTNGGMFWCYTFGVSVGLPNVLAHNDLILLLLLLIHTMSSMHIMHATSVCMHATPVIGNMCSIH